ncbi:MAG: DNA methyltransferase [bacterium]|nr:DNA methyltransferase [bacterium]
MTLQQQFEAFVAYWRQHIRGQERGDATSFIEYLFKALGYEGALQAGGHFEERVARRQDGRSATKFADYVIPRRVLIEMKSRGEDLRRHYDQALNYWIDLAENRPQYVILCNFDELWIYDLNLQPRDPMDKIRVEDLPQRHTALAFLLPIPQKPEFSNNRIAVTDEAAFSLSRVLRSIIKRGIDQKQAQRFVLQCLVALFAENIGLLPNRTFTRIIRDSLDHQDRLEALDLHFYDLVWILFTTMNARRRTPVGRFYEVPYFDGGLFAEIDPVELTTTELELLLAATQHNWSLIHPGIFGAVFEESLEKAERHQTGSHFTHEVDILRIVRPVITRPWHERIEAASDAAALRALHDELCAYRVFDPACGSGNFLYVAYREMKRLEREIFDRLEDLTEPYTPPRYVNTAQFYGYDIQPFAVELAKVTLMIAKKLSIDEVETPESALPLDNLNDNILEKDALFSEWPDFEACIGNPPYLGSRVIRTQLGNEYVNKLRTAYPQIPGNADYCVYWFRKAHEVMQTGARAGLVGTNTIRQNFSRIGGLDFVIANDGYIYEAVSSMPWSGDAAVNVSIAIWSKGTPPQKPRLWVDNGETAVELPFINSSLSLKTDVSSAVALECNVEPKRVYQGQIPGNAVFILQPNEARAMLKHYRSNSEVVYPFLIGRDLVSRPQGKPSRFVIDFGERDILDAASYQQPYERLKTAFSNSPASSTGRWWLHHRRRTEMIGLLSGLGRYIVCSEVTKRPIFDFVSPKIRPDHTLIVFGYEDDYDFGVLQSNLHWLWFQEKASTLRNDFRYTPHSVFDTFPWPQYATPTQIKAIGDAARTLHEFRRDRMSKSVRMTLREMYRSLELPGQNPLKDLHATLDRAVMAAYGFDPEQDVLEQLLALNLAVAARIAAGEAVTAPGIPTDYPNPAELVSEGCIQPPELI